MKFVNRYEAGKQLAKQLSSYRNVSAVFAIPRGGVPVGFEIAKTLNTPLEVVCVRKIGMPFHPEYGIGAVAEKDIILFDEQRVRETKAYSTIVAQNIREAKKELARQVLFYRQNKPLKEYVNKSVMVVDDGLATGISAKAALAAIKQLSPKQIIFAAPVCSADAVKDLQLVADSIVCVIMPLEFEAVGKWYEHFDQLSDADVLHLLEEGKKIPYSFNDTSRILK